MTRLCACGKPVTTGRTGTGAHDFSRCLPCQVAADMRGWFYPAARRQQRPAKPRLGRQAPNVKRERNAAIVAAVQGGRPAKAVAMEYGISADAVRKIVRREDG